MRLRCDLSIGLSLGAYPDNWSCHPDFDTGSLAFYHTRVLQIPTPRRSSHDAARFGKSLAALLEDIVTHQFYQPVGPGLGQRLGELRGVGEIRQEKFVQ